LLALHQADISGLSGRAWGLARSRDALNGRAELIDAAPAA